MDVVTVGDLLEEFLERERKQLEDALVVHGPTIGDMYEGLTGDVLGKALPQGLDLRVVSGFVTHNGVDSAQQDCMVVVGDGQPIPYVPDTWRYPPNQVLMIVEVKTSAHRAEVLEARNKYESVVSLYEAWIEEGGDPPVPWAAIEHAFAEVTGRVVRHGRLGDAPEVDQAVFTTITKRFMYPLFVLFGHDGFVSELGLRNSLAEWLVEGGVNAGIGVTDWPALLVSGGYSLVMAAGTTWAGPLDENSRWTFMMSSRNRRCTC